MTRAAVVLAILAVVALGFAGCRRGGVDTPTPAPTPTATATAAVEGQTPAAGDADIASLLLADLLGPDRAASPPRDIEVAAMPLGDGGFWFAVTSGSGIYELQDVEHRAAVFEQRAGAWHLVDSLTLETAPTLAMPEVVGVPGSRHRWVAVAGHVGAHGGTFEVLRFDGSALASVLSWYSAHPVAGQIADLNGDGTPEVVLDASDPYVFCYACGVSDYQEVIYRWVGDDLVEVELETPPLNLADAVAVYVREALALVGADLWRAAVPPMERALAAAPANDEVRWMALLLRRIADARLAQAGSDAQPLVTQVLAGEYQAAVALMRPHAPADLFSADGPLVAGTAAEGWGTTAGELLVSYATRAIARQPLMPEAYAVRALGRTLQEPADFAAALVDMDAALALAPNDAFYRAADQFLLARNGGVR